jgi:hypothetical protein
VVEAVLEDAIAVGVAKGLRASQETLDLGRQPAAVRSSIVSLQVSLTTSEVKGGIRDIL